jgi:hypothetical protein
MGRLMDAYLPAGFIFTQTALRSYLECPYRFRLRYIEQVVSPPLHFDPEAATALESGRRFHELARQHFLGLEVTALVDAAGTEVARWWKALEQRPPDLMSYPHRFPEAGLSIPLGRYRLSARYDLLAVRDDAALMVDWKTGRLLPGHDRLRGDIQTRVYLYVLAEGNAAYHEGETLPPDSLELMYWHPLLSKPVVFGYDAVRRDADAAYLGALIAEIASQSPEEMHPVEEDEVCGRCSYGPLCGRRAGEPEEWDLEETPFPDDLGAWSESYVDP